MNCRNDILSRTIYFLLIPLLVAVVITAMINIMLPKQIDDATNVFLVITILTIVFIGQQVHDFIRKKFQVCDDDIVC